MGDRFRVRSDGDLEAITVAETQRVLSEVLGPYCFTVSGSRGNQQAVFATQTHQTLFVLYVHEFIAESTDITAAPATARRNLSLLDAGVWMVDRYRTEADAAGWGVSAERLVAWLDRPIRLRFWSGIIGRHLTYHAPFRTIFSAYANLSKHGLLKLGSEINRLRSLCRSSGVLISEAEAVAATAEYVDHIRGMMVYHATEIAELTGRYFLGLHRFLRARFDLAPTNDLALIPAPAGVTDDLFKYLYASTVFQFSNWTEDRIHSSIPETGAHLKLPYPQHEDPDPES